MAYTREDEDLFIPHFALPTIARANIGEAENDNGCVAAEAKEDKMGDKNLTTGSPTRWNDVLTGFMWTVFVWYCEKKIVLLGSGMYIPDLTPSARTDIIWFVVPIAAGVTILQFATSALRESSQWILITLGLCVTTASTAVTLLIYWYAGGPEEVMPARIVERGQEAEYVRWWWAAFTIFIAVDLAAIGFRLRRLF